MVSLRLYQVPDHSQIKIHLPDKSFKDMHVLFSMNLMLMSKNYILNKVDLMKFISWLNDTHTRGCKT